MYNNDIILNEAFYGKNKDLIYIEKVILPKIKEVSLRNQSIKKYCKKELIQMEGIFSKLFGIDNVNITIGFHALQMQACTLTISMNDNKNTFPSKVTKEDYKMIKTPNGIRYKNTDKTMDIFISPYVFELEPNMTMAIILHEIGHNFFCINNFYKNNILLSVISNISGSLIKLLTNIHNPIMFRKNLMGLFESLISSLIIVFPKSRLVLSKLQTIIMGMNDFISDTIDIIPMVREINLVFQVLCEIAGITFIPSLIIKKVIAAPAKIKMFTIGALVSVMLGKFLPKLVSFSINSINYKNEEFADAFAASYGYGSGIVQAFSDLNNILPNVVFKSGSIFNQLAKTSLSIQLAMGSLFDEHPTSLARCENIVKKYEWELKNNKELTKKQKLELITDLNKTKDVLENYKSNDLSSKVGMFTKFIIDIPKQKLSSTINKVRDKDIYDFESTFKKSGLMNEDYDLYMLFV